MTDAPPSRDTIPLDVEACIQRLLAIARQTDPAVLAHEEHRAHVMDHIQAFRRWARDIVAPHARPTRVACKRCYFRMRRHPPMWRDACLLGLVRRECGAIAFASDTTLWDEFDARVRAL